MRIISIAGCLLVLSAAFIQGCKIDDRYDLNNLDTESTVMKGVTFPIGDLKPIYLKDVFHLSEADGYIVADPSGDYRIQYASDPIEICSAVPAEGSLVLVKETDGLIFQITSEEIPESLRDGSMVLELADLDLGFQVDSRIPFELKVTAALEALRDGNVLRSYALDGLPIVPGNTQFIFNESGNGPRSDVSYVPLPGLGNLLSPLPDQLKINDLTIESVGEDGVSYDPYAEYETRCRFSADGPVAFTENTRFQWTVPLENVSLDLDVVGLKKAELTMDVTNSVPFDFTVTATAFDAAGNRLQNVSASTDKAVSAGTVSNPTSTAVTITLMAEDLRFQGLELNLNAASNKTVAGTPLNEGQNLAMKNLLLTLPDGITVKL